MRHDAPLCAVFGFGDGGVGAKDAGEGGQAVVPVGFAGVGFEAVDVLEAGGGVDGKGVGRDSNVVAVLRVGGGVDEMAISSESVIDVDPFCESG